MDVRLHTEWLVVRFISSGRKEPVCGTTTRDGEVVIISRFKTILGTFAKRHELRRTFPRRAQLRDIASPEGQWSGTSMADD